MKTARKAILLTLCALMLVVSAVMGTVAYFTDTDQAVNTFTVGKVGISMDELDTDDDNNTADNKGYTIGGKYVVRDQANKYHLIPGMTYTKDPTIHVDADSEDCYLFVKVENDIKDIEIKESTDKNKTVAEQMAALNWKTVDGIDNLYIFAKEGDKYPISKGADVVVFNEFTIDGASVNNDLLAQYQGKQIIVTAYAVQKAGFEDSTPVDIWNATFGA